MAGPLPVELSADCPRCGLEAGLVEIFDVLVPACRFGLAATSRCKLCEATSEGRLDKPPGRALREIPANRCPACLHELDPTALDERSCRACGARAIAVVTVAGREMTKREDLEAALDAWAARAGFASRAALIEATFVERDVSALFARLGRGERLEVLADPFANMGVRTTAGPPPAAPPAPVPAAAPTPAPAPRFTTTEPLPPPPPPSAPPRAIVYPLVSVIVADGEVHRDECDVIDRFLRAEGLAPLSEEELRVHHPSEVARFVPPERREDVVKLMCETASADGMHDESERRVIRAYATAWDIPDEKVDFWLWGYENMASSMYRQLWLRIRRFVLSARWSEAEEKR
jgi:uncharacterized tellurite resistance protein B-like protein